MNSTLRISGRWYWEKHSAGGLLLAVGVVKNGIVTAALNDLLNVYFRSVTQKPDWYMGVIDSDNFDELAAADTMSSHAGWLEATAYSESTRRPWSPGAASDGNVVNATRSRFTATQTVTLKGLFLASDDTKGGTSGTLWATGLFDSDQTLAAGETLGVAYDLTAANS